MRTPPKSRGPSDFRAFLHITQRRVPFITMCAQTFDYHTSETAPRIDPFASQNLARSPQPQAEQGLTNARVIHSTLGFCVTTSPALPRHPVADASHAFRRSVKLPTSPPRAPRHDKIKSLPTMERASKLIRGLKLSGDVITPEQLCCAAWPEAVGKKIAGHTRPAKLVRTRLVVEVEDHIWQRQLFALTPHILNNLENTLGRGLVEDLEFRIVPRRREPLMARQAVPALPVDDADAIADPLMRGIYKLSRKKAQA